MTLIGEYIPEFTTGTLLSELISQLEKIKIPGVEKEPKTKTSALKNIRRALDILKRKPTFPQHLTAGEELIFQGDGNFIRTMLHEMMKIYRLRASRSSLKSMKSESSFRLESV